MLVGFALYGQPANKAADGVHPLPGQVWYMDGIASSSIHIGRVLCLVNPGKPLGNMLPQYLTVQINRV